MEIRTILLPTDFSECGNYALSYAASLARTFKASIICVNVIEPIVPPGVGGERRRGVEPHRLRPQESGEERRGIVQLQPGAGVRQGSGAAGDCAGRRDPPQRLPDRVFPAV